MSSTNALEVLIQALRRLPGVGVKSAQRMAFHLMQHDRAGAEALSVALHDAVQNVHHCGALPHVHRRRYLQHLPGPGARCFAAVRGGEPRLTSRRWSVRGRSKGFTLC